MSDPAKNCSMIAPEPQVGRGRQIFSPGNSLEFLAGNVAPSLPRQLEKLAQQFGERIALTAPSGDPLTYARLFEQISRIVQSLNGLDVGRGDRIALTLPNAQQTAIAFIGVSSSATCAPLNPSLRVAEFTSIFDALRPKALMVETGSVSEAVLAAQMASIPIIELSFEGEELSRDAILRGEALGPPAIGGMASTGDVALILFTSGTTAQPKLVPLTHANLLTSALNIATTLKLSPADRCLNIMPLFHIHGLVAGLLASLVSGGGVVCPTGFSGPLLFQWLAEFQPTWYTAVPTMHQTILRDAPANIEIIRRNPLRFMRSSSAALPRRVMEELETFFEAPVIESYGMTEAAHQMASNPLPPGQR
ncbi:MAG: AMP-binding protein, partial [Candidatus Binatia bacterium]